MKRYLFYYLCMNMVLLEGCQSKQEYKDIQHIKYADFGIPISLQGEEVFFDEPVLKPMGVLAADSILFVYSMLSDKLLCRYNLNTMKKTGEYISFGSGPEELMHISNMQILDSLLWIIDSNSRRGFGYNLLNISNSDTVTMQSRIQIKDAFSRMNILRDGSSVATAYNPEHNRLTFFDMNGNYKFTNGDFPFFRKDITAIENIEGFTANLMYSPENERIYLFCLATDLIEVFDTEGNILSRVHGPDFFFPEVREQHFGDGSTKVAFDFDKGRDAYLGPLVVADEIFVLYSGASSSLRNGNKKDKILVFNKDLDPLRYYQLSEPVFNMAIDVNSKTIYAITDEPEFRIIKYKY
ncbi:hypothetical protein M2101_001362 [Parabacteroides sp. PM5-20]|uniref:BF3164 family lipoprotein n=1 Tax=unclassified Parabacteroides TaxID=2649774 RepID=UPI0013D2D14B|nr:MULTISPECIES: BF3164 family lipoprotein [unclassified Parabacteroides]MDH6534686.1 hypothetical protein [Parabacteroides sp. PM5-20]